MLPLRNLLARVRPRERHDYEPIVNDNLHLRNHKQPSRPLRHVLRRFFTLRNLIIAVPVVLLSILLLNGFPSLYYDIRDFERRFPQHNASFSENGGVRYLAFPDHLWGNGWNNILQEYLMSSYLASITNRSYVFDDYTWSHVPLPYTIYDWAFRPTRVPLNAFISGPVAGGPISASSSSASPRAVHREFWESVCPPEKRHVIKSTDTPSDVRGVDLIRWWKDEIGKYDDVTCLEVDMKQRPVFDFNFFGGQELLDIWPSLSQTPILTQFNWSPLVLSAIQRNFVSLSDPHDVNDNSPPTIAHTDTLHPIASQVSTAKPAAPEGQTYPALVAVHIRHGDYKRHCPRLATWGAGFHGFNSFKGLPDPWIPITGVSAEERTEYYRKHCFPTQDEVVQRLHTVREEHNAFLSSSTLNSTANGSPTPGHKLRRVFVLSNAWPIWLDGLKHGLLKDGWDDVIFGGDLIMDKEQKGVDVAVDMSIAERAEVFVGNGFSSLSGNIVMLRIAKGLHAWTNRFL